LKKSHWDRWDDSTTKGKKMISKNTKLQAIFYHKSFVSSAVLILVSSMHAQAGPGGGQVTSGAAQITQSGNVTNITQSSTNASLVWKSFNVSPTETVNFLQPSASSVAVNKITDSNASQILGNINSNGQIFLINPSGILFGNGAQVNVGGLVASTLDLNSSLSVNTKVFTDSNPNKTYLTGVTNLGTLTSTGTSVKGGYIALLGNTVSNLGTINSPQGTVALGSGSSVTLTMQNSNLLSMQIDQNILKSLTENGGVIHASGGLVLLSSGAKDALVASVVNNTGLIEARTVSNQSGNIVLLGGMTAGTVNVGGTLDASAPHSGNGGLIETSASSVNVSSAAIITSESLNGKNGTWLIDPSAYTIAPTGGNMTGAALSASLSLNNVTIESTSGTNTNLGDITVNDSVNWNSNKTLTLSADNNININQSITSTNASAGLALLYGQGAISADNYAVINIKAPVNLASAQSFSTNLGSDGTPKVFRVITSLGAAGSTSSNDLQGISGNLAINYALGNDIDAKPTANWNAQTGFVPIAGFAGTLDGLGHTISNLVINLPGTASVGLIGTAGATAVVQNLGLLGGYTIGGAGTGALLGSGGTAQVINSFATGNVNGAASTGGLVGTMTSGNIINSYSTGNVKNGVAASVGGLLGSGTSGNVSNSFASGAVTGGAGAGGLVGAITTGNITNSYATGAVSGGAGSGGLVGTITTGNISNTYSTGSVKGDAGTGGLVGVGTTGVITNSYATGLISGAGAGRGGLIGTTSAISVGSFWDTTGTAMSVSTGAGAIGMTQRT
jgi:filamentous hemagglutinin family protein